MKYLILGAGPAGLAFASHLQDNEDSFLILEKESTAGGLCRSVSVDGFPLDIGGGHFLDTRKPDITNYLFQYMPVDDWNHFSRDSRIDLNGAIIHHPIEANIWEMPIPVQVEYLKSIALAGCNIGIEKPINFVEWIYWKLGEKIAANYMIPYNKKMFCENLDFLGTYWLDKLPDVSFEETLLSCLEKRPYGKQPGHAQFYYPKKTGYGELWIRMSEKIKDHILYRKKVTHINVDTNSVITEDGDVYQGNIIINTIPWTSFKFEGNIPDVIFDSIKELKYSSIRIDYYPENKNSNAHWIYYPDMTLEYHRILLRNNFCFGSNGYWTETNINRVKGNDTSSQFTYENEYAYPLNTIDKPKAINEILSWAKTRNIIGLGRWGEWMHYNSDVVVEKALCAANFAIKNY